MKKLLSILSLIVVTVCASLPAVSQSFKASFTQFQLDNGLRVLLSEDRSAPVVAVVVYYDVGSRNEVKGRSGFAHLFEHMMFQGSENVGKAQHFKYIESNGGTMNASTHADFTDYYDYLPSNQLELALWLESDRMRSLKITPENLQNQKEAVKEEKRLSFDNQAYWPALLKMDEMVFRNWANAHSTIGSMEDLDAANITDVKRFFEIYYAPNNAVLAIAGDIDSVQAEALVRKYFGTIPRQQPPPPVDVSEPETVAQARSVTSDPLAQVPAVAIAWKIPARNSPDFYSIALLKAMLFDGESARVYRALVKEKELAIEVTGTLEARRGPGQVAVLAAHKAKAKPEAIEALIEAEIERVKSEGVRADELNKVKNQYRLARFAGGSEGELSSLQTPLGRALSLAEFTMFDGEPSLINSEIDRYLAVTPEQIREAAIRYFGAANRAVLVISPAKARP
ncbi:MAG TPA: pitrilysin family protein [Blastocatellia bacterium]|nr:pitrilysin family protein [Blastocatellia bacterium]